MSGSSSQTITFMPRRYVSTDTSGYGPIGPFLSQPSAALGAGALGGHLGVLTRNPVVGVDCKLLEEVEVGQRLLGSDDDAAVAEHERRHRGDAAVVGLHE